MKFYVYIFLFFCFTCCALTSYGADKKKPNKEKKGFLTDSSKWTLEVPLWIPGFRGDFAYGEVEIEGEDGTIPNPEHPIEKPGFGSVFKRLFRTRFDLNYFFMRGATYENNGYFGEIDMFMGALGASLIFRSHNHKLVSASVHVDLMRLYGGYNLYQTQWLDERATYKLGAFGGARIHHFYVKTKLNDVNVSMDIEPIWVEPVLGVRNKMSFERWEFVVQGDMGSFWINDKYSFMLNMLGSYRVGNSTSIKLGWTSWYTYYKDRFRDENLRLKTHLAGPMAVVAFHF
jgi:hypothetical protein